MNSGGNLNLSCLIIPHSWETIAGNVDTMRWCCGFPLKNGSCAQGFEINVQAGAVLGNSTDTNENPMCAHGYPVAHDVAIGAGVGVPAAMASIIMLLLWLRERQARRREKRKMGSMTSNEAPCLQHRTKNQSVTTITSDESP